MASIYSLQCSFPIIANFSKDVSKFERVSLRIFTILHHLPTVPDSFNFAIKLYRYVNKLSSAKKYLLSSYEIYHFTICRIIKVHLQTETCLKYILTCILTPEVVLKCLLKLF